MAKKINKLKFNLTSDMSILLIKFNKLKIKYEKTKDEKLLKELNDTRKQFIEKFRIYNKKEIEEYLKLTSREKA